MVTTVRHFGRPVSLVLLTLFVSSPGLGWAEPRPDPGTTRPVTLQPSEGAPSVGDAPARPLASLTGVPSNLTPPSGDRPTDRSPHWFDADASAASGSWWSRRTTAQRTWFIVGLVVGAYGIYAVAGNSSKSHSSGGGGGGGGGY